MGKAVEMKVTKVEVEVELEMEVQMELETMVSGFMMMRKDKR